MGLLHVYQSINKLIKSHFHITIYQYSTGAKWRKLVRVFSECNVEQLSLAFVGMSWRGEPSNSQMTASSRLERVLMLKALLSNDIASAMCLCM